MYSFAKFDFGAQFLTMENTKTELITMLLLNGCSSIP